MSRINKKNLKGTKINDSNTTVEHSFSFKKRKPYESFSQKKLWEALEQKNNYP